MTTQNTKNIAFVVTAIFFLLFLVPYSYADTFNITSVSTETDAYLQSFLIIIIGLAFFIVGGVFGNYVMYFASAGWFFANSVALYLNTQSFEGSYVFYTIIALYIAYLGIFTAQKQTQWAKFRKNKYGDDD
jgi:hypothetical protein